MKATSKSTRVRRAETTRSDAQLLEVTNVNQELGEIGGVFVQKQPSDTDQGTRVRAADWGHKSEETIRERTAGAVDRPAPHPHTFRVFRGSYRGSRGRSRCKPWSAQAPKELLLKGSWFATVNKQAG